MSSAELRRGGSTRVRRNAPGPKWLRGVLGAAAGLGSALALAACAPRQAVAECPRDGALGVAREIWITSETAGESPWLGGQALGLAPGEVVLTYDDGPHLERTLKVAAALEAECARATFLFTGGAARAAPAVARRLADAGHTVGGHSDTHASLGDLPLAEAIAEIENGDAAILEALGREGRMLRLFRYPSFSVTPELADWTDESGRISLGADIDPQDWSGARCATVVRRVMDDLAEQGGGVVLLHDPMRSSACSTRRILSRLKADGWRLVHLRVSDEG